MPKNIFDGLTSNDNDFQFSSSIDISYRKELEKLLFFNPQQFRYQASIELSIENLGSPKIIVSGETLKVNIGLAEKVQTIFAIDCHSGSKKLVGLILFSRYQFDQILVLHIAIHENYAWHGLYGDKALVFAMIAKVYSTAKNIRGIKTLNIIYAHGDEKIVKIPVYHCYF